MKRYLMTLLAAGMMADIACAAEAPQSEALQIASMDKEATFTGYKTDLLDKNKLNRTMAESLRSVTWDDRRLQRISVTQSKMSKNPRQVGGNK